MLIMYFQQFDALWMLKIPKNSKEIRDYVTSNVMGCCDGRAQSKYSERQHE